MISRSSLADYARPFVAVAAAAVLAGAVAGCASLKPTETTGSLGSAASASPTGEDDRRRDADALSERYRANPNDPDVAIQYAQALRASGQRAQAVAVLEQASLRNPKSMELLALCAAAVPAATAGADVLGRARIARSSRLAHPSRRGRVHSDGTPKTPNAIDRAEDRPGEPSVLSTGLPACQRPAARNNTPLLASQSIVRACARIAGGGLLPLCGSGSIARADLRRTKLPPMSPICGDAGAKAMRRLTAGGPTAKLSCSS
jgi:hypothetical protein